MGKEDQNANFTEMISKAKTELQSKNKNKKQLEIEEKQENYENKKNKLISIRKSTPFLRLQKLLDSGELRELLKAYFDSFYDPKYNKLPFDKATEVINHFDKSDEELIEELNGKEITRIAIITIVMNVGVDNGEDSHGYPYSRENVEKFEMMIDGDLNDIIFATTSDNYDEWKNKMAIKIAENEIRKEIEEKQRVETRPQRLEKYKQMLLGRKKELLAAKGSVAEIIIAKLGLINYHNYFNEQELKDLEDIENGRDIVNFK